MWTSEALTGLRPRFSCLRWATTACMMLYHQLRDLGDQRRDPNYLVLCAGMAVVIAISNAFQLLLSCEKCLTRGRNGR